MALGYRRAKYACYTANLTLSVVGTLSPLLFLTFRTLYGVSYAELGLLVLINFVTQLTVDLLFSFFSHKFHIPLTVKLLPVVAIAGLLIYAAAPIFFPNEVFAGLLIGTVIFSAAGGLGEVLISPVIAAIPSDNPDREMSRLHSVYAWGVVGVFIVGALFLLAFGALRWQWLTLLFILIPVCSAILFSRAKIPHMETPARVSGVLVQLKNPGLWLCVIAIFFGGASECTMAQWCSGYIERALGIPKLWGDLFGAALFSVMLGLGRSLYAKYGKNITRVLIVGAIGATAGYFVAAVARMELIGLIACVLTGFCVSMMWPGCLIAATDRFQQGGVFVFALMAAGGDLGASVGAQTVGVVIDAVSMRPNVVLWAERFGITVEQVGMKIGMLVGAIFPMCAIIAFAFLHKAAKRERKK